MQGVDIRRMAIQCLVGVGIATLSGGCGTRSSEPIPQLYPVRGTVRVDGVALANGEIVFEGADDAELALAPATASVVAGSYEAAVGSGKKTVRIFAPVEVGEPDVTGVRAKKETIAPNFNTKSTIVVEISPADGNEFNFEVKSR